MPSFLSGHFDDAADPPHAGDRGGLMLLPPPSGIAAVVPPAPPQEPGRLHETLRRSHGVEPVLPPPLSGASRSVSLRLSERR
jgi:hypothetical protein